jgi:hypothetical protein
MNGRIIALTDSGRVDVETDVPLDRLVLGDIVLGLADPDDPTLPRSTFKVTKTLGKHHVPLEDPTLLERIITKTGLVWLLAGEREEGILVEGLSGPAMFTLDHTPTLDRFAY